MLETATVFKIVRRADVLFFERRLSMLHRLLPSKYIVTYKKDKPAVAYNNSRLFAYAEEPAARWTHNFWNDGVSSSYELWRCDATTVLYTEPYVGGNISPVALDQHWNTIDLTQYERNESAPYLIALCKTITLRERLA